MERYHCWWQNQSGLFATILIIQYNDYRDIILQSIDETFSEQIGPRFQCTIMLTSREVRTYVKEQDVQVLWSALSPDLIPLEGLWYTLDRCTAVPNNHGMHDSSGTYEIFDNVKIFM